MIVLKYLDRGCMRFGATKRRNRRQRRIGKFQLLELRSIGEERPIKIICRTKREIAELLFENCTDCRRMAAIPQGAFAACKVRRNQRAALITPVEEKEKLGKENMFSGRPPVEGREPTPLKYNSKLMNSIWGLYNRYSVHNFKKNTDADEGVTERFVAVWEAALKSYAPAANMVAAAAVTNNNSSVMKNENSI